MVRVWPDEVLHWTPPRGHAPAFQAMGLVVAGKGHRLARNCLTIAVVRWLPGEYAIVGRRLS